MQRGCRIQGHAGPLVEPLFLKDSARKGQQVPAECNRCSNLISAFSFLEKTIMRMSFYGFIIVGAYGICMESFAWGMAYISFAIFGLTFVVLFCLCAHCPYPYKHSTCLFLPFEWVKKLYRYRSDRMGVLDKIGWITMILSLTLIPQCFLIRNLQLLALFWFSYIPMLLFPFYYCRRCRHIHCPLNLVGVKK